MMDASQDRTDRRNALLCVAACLLSLLACWPFAPTPFNDDWSYAFTVKHLLETGQFAYNGWATAAGVGHVYWGLAWTRVFGFSFDVLRLSTVPLACGAVSLIYKLSRHAGLRPGYAVFTALLVATSPVFMPVAVSFMTDVPGLFFILLALYTLVRSAEAESRTTAIGWMLLGVMIGMLGGISRQIVWVAPLAVVPYLIFLRRADLMFFIVGAVAWSLLIGGIVFTMHWFARQPFALPEPSVLVDLKRAYHGPAKFFADLLRLLLTVVLLALPAAIAAMSRWRGRTSVIALVLWVGCLVALRHRPHWAVEPWMGNTLDATGILGHYELGGGMPPKMLIDPVRWVISAGVYAATAFIAVNALCVIVLTRRGRSRVIHLLTGPGRDRVTLRILVVFAAGYLALLLPRVAHGDTYDRYALPLIACLAIPLLLSCQQSRRSPPAVAWIALIFFAIYGIGSTQELFALGRARAAAADRLLDAGVPRTQIGGGMEFDNWTELEVDGHVNSTRIVNPVGAYRPGLGLWPSVHPIYRLEFSPTTDTVPSMYGGIDYTTAWPPWRRKVWIDRVVSAKGE